MVDGNGVDEEDAQREKEKKEAFDKIKKRVGIVSHPSVPRASDAPVFAIEGLLRMVGLLAAYVENP